jgi:pilus assembly protein CpaB
MDRRFITVLGVSLLFALVVTSVFYQAINKGPSKSTVDAKTDDQKDVVVAVKPLAVGTTIKAGDVKLAKVPLDQFPKNAFSKVEEVLDRPIISNILQDEAILEPRLAQRGSQGVSALVPEGMRAVSVRVTDDTAVSGFVQPGMRVDVLVTGRPPAGGDVITRTVLQNILVLTAGAQIQADARGQAVSAPTVTLVVSPEEAEVLTLAGNEGRIKLVLRNGADTKETSTPGTNMSHLYRGVRGKSIFGNSGSNSDDDAERPRVAVRRRAPVEAAPEPMAPRPPVQAPPDQIVVIRGDKRSVEIVKPATSGPDAPATPPANQ